MSEPNILNFYIFTDCHVDGADPKYTKQEYMGRLARACDATEKLGGVLIFLGDNVDYKNSLDPRGSIEFLNYSKQYVNKRGIKAVHLCGNHDDGHGDLNSGIDPITFPEILLHHGDQCFLGATRAIKRRTYTPGCGTLMRTIKRIGSTYRNLFGWEPSKKDRLSLSKMHMVYNVKSRFAFVGHVHPKGIVRYKDDRCEHFIFPRGQSYAVWNRDSNTMYAEIVV